MWFELNVFELKQKNIGSGSQWWNQERLWQKGMNKILRDGKELDQEPQSWKDILGQKREWGGSGLDRLSVWLSHL